MVVITNGLSTGWNCHCSQAALLHMISWCINFKQPLKTWLTVGWFNSSLMNGSLRQVAPATVATLGPCIWATIAPRFTSLLPFDHSLQCISAWISKGARSDTSILSKLLVIFPTSLQHSLQVNSPVGYTDPSYRTNMPIALSTFPQMPSCDIHNSIEGVLWSHTQNLQKGICFRHRTQVINDLLYT